MNLQFWKKKKQKNKVAMVEPAPTGIFIKRKATQEDKINKIIEPKETNE